MHLRLPTYYLLSLLLPHTPTAHQVRASDFAVCVRRLPAHHTDPTAVKAHFAFFGPVASVAIAVENEPLMRLIRQQQQLKARHTLTLTLTPILTLTPMPTLTLSPTLTQARWRRLHLLYARELQASPP